MTPDTSDEIDFAASYSRQDSARVVPLLDALKARGVRVWFDKHIPGGALWEETITKNMRRARAVVFFVSRDSLASDRCFDEVSAARTLRKPIIPILVERLTMPDDLPDRLVLTLQTRNTVDAFPGADGDPVEAILHALATISGAAAPAQAPQPARLAPPPPRRKNHRGIWLGAGGLGALTAIGLGVAFALGLFGPPAPKIAIGDAEWCSVSAPRLMDRALKQINLPDLQLASDRGDTQAQTLVCLSANQTCTDGSEPVNLAPAYAACEQAGAKGNWRAVFNTGWLKQRGCGVSVDGKGAVASYRRAAEAGCAIAQFYLATLYLEGQLVDPDEPQGIAWLQKSADQNYPPALNLLGARYALGRGVPEDDVRGTELYRRAADLGDARAMINYARALERGVGVEMNTGAAITYYRRASQQTDDKDIQRQAREALVRLGADQRD